jgi:hypothetical protein
MSTAWTPNKNYMKYIRDGGPPLVLYTTSSGEVMDAINRSRDISFQHRT